MTSDSSELAFEEGLLGKMKPEALARLQGELFQIFAASDRHRDLTLTEFARSILPPIHLNQFRVYRAGAQPVGFVSWALFSEAEGAAYMAGDYDFTPGKWASGDQLWFIDYIAPFGHAIAMAEDLRDNVFPDRIAYAPDIDDATGRKRVRLYRGRNRGGKAQKAEVDKVLREL